MSFSRGYKTSSVLSLFCYSSFASILKRKKKLIALLLLSYKCLVTVNALWLFLTVHGIGMWCMIVVFPDHTHFLFVQLELLSLMKKSSADVSALLLYFNIKYM